jgi:hypothetical protein
VVVDPSVVGRADAGCTHDSRPRGRTSGPARHDGAGRRTQRRASRSIPASAGLRIAHRLLMRTRSAPSRSPARDADWRLRLRVRVGRRVDGNPARALRARQLSSAAGRRAIAACLANILDAADECQVGLASPRLLLDHAPVIAARSEIVAVIELLRGDTALETRGIALARLLADDPAGPLLHPCPDRTVGHAVTEIIDAL